MIWLPAYIMLNLIATTINLGEPYRGGSIKLKLVIHDASLSQHASDIRNLNIIYLDKLSVPMWMIVLTSPLKICLS